MNNNIYEFGRSSYITTRRAISHWKNLLIDPLPKLLILVYHRILPEVTSDPFHMVVKLKTFIKQIDQLARNYPTISLSKAIEQCRIGQSKAKIQIILTFDDGYADIYDLVFPVLKKKGLTGIIFLPTNYVGGFIPGFLTTRFKDVSALDAIKGKSISWQQTGEMNEAGFEIGAHGLSHRSLTKIPLRDAIEEIKMSKEAIEQNLGKPCNHFAFPFGSRRDYSQHLIDYVKELGKFKLEKVFNKFFSLFIMFSK